jgi:hypothetical protein
VWGMPGNTVAGKDAHLDDLNAEKSYAKVRAVQSHTRKGGWASLC